MKVDEALAQFGLNEKERTVYLTLAKKSWVTALQLSRICEYKRPTVYRILETLKKQGLVEVKLDDKTTFYNLADPKNFESKVTEQEKKAKELRGAFGVLEQQVKVLTEGKRADTNVKFYRGVEGLKQIQWKLVEIDNREILVLDSDQWGIVLGKEFNEKLRVEYVTHKVRVRELSNPDKTTVIHPNGKAVWTTNVDYVAHCFRHRLVLRDVLDITHDIYVAGDRIYFSSFREGDFMGIEIVNGDFAKMQRQYFEVVWAQAKAIDNFGGGFT